MQTTIKKNINESNTNSSLQLEIITVIKSELENLVKELEGELGIKLNVEFVSNCGYVLIKKDSGIDKPREAAQSLIDEYNDVLSGNVYGYQIMFKDEIIESCWGFVGNIDKSGIIDEAKGIIDYTVEQNKEKFATQLALEL